VKPGRVISALCRMFLTDPAYPGFMKSLAAKAERGDPEDARLHRMLAKAPHGLRPAWEWTEKDSEECLAILRANPRFGEYLDPRPGND
jgi:hypothetical protein